MIQATHSSSLLVHTLQSVHSLRIILRWSSSFTSRWSSLATVSTLIPKNVRHMHGPSLLCQASQMPRSSHKARIWLTFSAFRCAMSPCNPLQAISNGYKYLRCGWSLKGGIASKCTPTSHHINSNGQSPGWTWTRQYDIPSSFTNRVAIPKLAAILAPCSTVTYKCEHSPASMSSFMLTFGTNNRSVNHPPLLSWFIACFQFWQIFLVIKSRMLQWCCNIAIIEIFYMYMCWNNLLLFEE